MGLGQITALASKVLSFREVSGVQTVQLKGSLGRVWVYEGRDQVILKKIHFSQSLCWPRLSLAKPGLCELLVTVQSPHEFLVEMSSGISFLCNKCSGLLQSFSLLCPIIQKEIFNWIFTLA